jgi:hypothetical protein
VVTALHRAHLYVNAVRRIPDAPDTKTPWKALQHARQRTNDLRNAIEHTEDKIRRHELIAKSPGLYPGRDSCQWER